VGPGGLGLSEVGTHIPRGLINLAGNCSYGICSQRVVHLIVKVDPITEPTPRDFDMFNNAKKTYMRDTSLVKQVSKTGIGTKDSKMICGFSIL
jgi:hypothetical protein